MTRGCQETEPQLCPNDAAHAAAVNPVKLCSAIAELRLNTPSHNRVTGSQGAGSSGCEAILPTRIRRESESSTTAATQDGVPRKAKGLFSMLRVAPLRPKRPSLIQEKIALNSTYASLDDLEILNTIGMGGFGRVKLCKSKTTGIHLALKMLRKSEIMRTQQAVHVCAERSILQELDHPYIVRLHATYQDPHHVYMLLDFVPGGDFFSHLRYARRFSPATAAHYVGCIVLALDYMHGRDVVYRDLKPENMLLDVKGRIKLSDFGLAKKVTGRTWTLCGTPEYLAPEIILTKGHSKAVDWWALGVCIYEFLAGYPPFYHENTLEIYGKILKGQVEFPPHFSPAAKEIISLLLQADPSKRFGGCVADVKSHKFFAEVDYDSLEDGSAPAPIVPRVTHPGDTCNFEDYAEDDSLPPAIAAYQQDAFSEF